MESHGILAFIGAALTLLGSIFLFLGALGIFRMPDVYNRMQAGTKATTLGNMLTLLGLGLLIPGWLPKIITIILFVLITNPISSHALARAAHRHGVRLASGSVLDALSDDEKAAGIEPGTYGQPGSARQAAEVEG
ncbi:MAG: monovalent cation/H(+) antiporter subunit G [Lysobacterales bacterium]|jgi:multicomponent Na+:H+ antiporter subunit G